MLAFFVSTCGGNGSLPSCKPSSWARGVPSRRKDGTKSTSERKIKCGTSRLRFLFEKELRKVRSYWQTLILCDLSVSARLRNAFLSFAVRLTAGLMIDRNTISSRGLSLIYSPRRSHKRESSDFCYLTLRDLVQSLIVILRSGRKKQVLLHATN